MKYFGKNTIITGNVILHNDVSIWHNTVIRCECESITIGASTNVQDLVTIHTSPSYPVFIGESVSIGHRAILHGCTVHDHCLIGMGAILMNGVVVGKNCIVGAGSLLTQNKHFPDGTLIMGSPAKVVRKLTDEEIASITQNAVHYVQLAKTQSEDKKRWFMQKSA